MSNFKYLTAVDKQYYDNTPQSTLGMGDPDALEKPIVPVRDLGVTVPESDPRTGAHILQNVQAAIRSGAKNLQIVMSTPSTTAIGGRPKAYGKEVRQAIKEVAQSSKVNIKGVEMPTSSITNMSGYDPQRGFISTQKQQEDMQEVKEAIQFVADVTGPGGVDIWSQEFPRTIFDMSRDKKWNPIVGKKMVDGKEKNIYLFQDYEGEDELAVKHLVDKRTGRVIQEIRMNQQVAYPEWETVKAGEQYYDTDANEWRTATEEVYVDLEKRKVPLAKRVPKWNPEEERFDVKPRDWGWFKKEADLITQERQERLGKDFNPEKDNCTVHEAFFIATTRAQEAVAEGWAMNYQSEIENDRQRLEKLNKALQVYSKIEEAKEQRSPEELEFFKRETDQFSEFVPPETKKPTEIIQKQIKQIRQRLTYNTELAKGQLQQAEDLRLQRENVVTAEKFAKEKAVNAYADLGVYAYNETKNRGFDKPLYVGPEIGWPTGWGGHPQEFKELIIGARKEMQKKLIEKDGLSEREAKHIADNHIKGCFDTGHMGMWLNKFRKIDGESEKQRLEEFNKWYMEQVEDLAKSGVVGSIQAVDSMTGAHGHLPPGQGVFPVKDAVVKFKDLGFQGWVVSEGHEEEKFGANRILLKTWEEFGSPIHSSGMYGMPQTWGGVNQAYFGNTYPPYFVTQSYVPVNDYKLWSEVLME